MASESIKEITISFENFNINLQRPSEILDKEMNFFSQMDLKLIENLNLGFNLIIDEGVKLLSKMKFEKLRIFDLCSNEISDEELKFLAKMYLSELN